MPPSNHYPSLNVGDLVRNGPDWNLSTTSPGDMLVISVEGGLVTCQDASKQIHRVFYGTVSEDGSRRIYQLALVKPANSGNPNGRTLKVGDKVKKGRDWQWGDAFSNVEGVVIIEHDAALVVVVKWPDGSNNFYRDGTLENGVPRYDLDLQGKKPPVPAKAVVNQPWKDSNNYQNIIVGTKVQRGPHFTNHGHGDEQDGGAGKVGTVVHDYTDGYVSVKWEETESVADYRVFDTSWEGSKNWDRYRTIQHIPAPTVLSPQTKQVVTPTKNAEFYQKALDLSAKFVFGGGTMEAKTCSWCLQPTGAAHKQHCEAGIYLSNLEKLLKLTTAVKPVPVDISPAPVEDEG